MEAMLHNDTYQWVNIIRGVWALGSLSLPVLSGAPEDHFCDKLLPCIEAEALKSHIEMEYSALSVDCLDPDAATSNIREKKFRQGPDLGSHPSFSTTRRKSAPRLDQKQ
jgi:hypothetical protein